MTATIHLDVDASDVALAVTMAAEPGLRFEVVGVGGVHQSVSPQVRVQGPTTDLTTDALLDLLAGDPSVADAQLLSETDDTWLVWLEWADEGLLPAALLPGDAAVSIGDLSGQSGTWAYELVCVDDATLPTLSDHWENQNLTVSVRKVVSEASVEEDQLPSLTDVQGETLELAYEHGYYEIPRDVQLEELSSAMGVSHQATSERLRRAHGALVAERFSRDEPSRVAEPAD